MTTAAVVSLRLARVADAAAVAEAAGRQWLADAERARLDAITAPGRRAQFLAGRWTLRQLLASEMGGDALRDWPLTAGIDGPPRPQTASPPDVHLALSHSGDWLACAVAPVPIGLDIEVPKPRRRLDELVAAVFTASEQAAFAATEPSGRADLFHAVWTLKEAWLKRHAEGVSPGRLAQVHTRPATPAEANARVWSGGGLALALVVPCDAPLKWSGEAPELASASPQWWQVGG